MFQWQTLPTYSGEAMTVSPMNSLAWLASKELFISNLVSHVSFQSLTYLLIIEYFIFCF